MRPSVSQFAMAAAWGAAVLVAVPAMAKDAAAPGKIVSCTRLLDQGGSANGIGRGESLGITCAQARRGTAEVRVVLQFDAAPGETPLGYGAVIATEQSIEDGVVRVRVPNLPDLANRTAAVKVYVIDAGGTHSCDAGRIKIL
jgi:hypothetical protein